METQILKLEAPFDYIYCNGEVGKHIATYIVGESRIGEDGKYTLETHSHPIVQYKDSPKGVVWNRAELTDCEVLCSEDDMRIEPFTFCLLCNQIAEQKEKADEAKGEYTTSYDPADEAEPLKEKLARYGMSWRVDNNDKDYEVLVEVGSCSEGYFAQPLFPDSLLYFNYVEPALEELAKRLTEEREWQEEFFDHTIRIHYKPDSSLAIGFVENL